MLDISVATNCIRAMRKNGTYRDHKIGVVRGDVHGETSMISGVPSYRPGQVVLFREEMNPSDSQLCLGEYRGIEQKPTGRVTIEVPYVQSEIEKETARGGSLITTFGTMIGVPREYLEEIRI